MKSWIPAAVVIALVAGLVGPVQAQSAHEDDDFELEIEEESATPPPTVYRPSSIVTTRAVIELRDDLKHEADEDVFEQYGRFDISSSVDLRPGVFTKISGRIRTNYREHQSEGLDIPFTGELGRWSSSLELQDLFVGWNREAFSVRLGNQVLPWGETDFGRPLDVLNPYDYRDGLAASTESPAVPTPMLRLDWRANSKVSFQAAYLPTFEPHRFHVFGSDQAPMGLLSDGVYAQILPMITDFLDPSLWDVAQPLLQATERPSHPITDAQVGTAVNIRLQGFDFGLYYAYLYDRFPEMEFNEDLATVLIGSLNTGFDSAQFLELLADPDFKEAYDRVQENGADLSSLLVGRYRRLHMAGISVGTSLGSIGIRSDVAFFSRRTLYATDFQAIQSPVIVATAGMDYIRGDSFDMVIEGTSLILLDPPETPLLVLDDHWEQIFGSLRWRFLDDRSLQLSLGGMVGLKEFDWLAMAELRYRIGPSHAFAVGARIMDGEPNTLGGLFDKNDELFLRYEWFL
ncbi:MAG: hypothetical protein CMH54_15765 [Myxococcales bacterium]|nr:hypothetical protein [Myxococcales bacterium]|tara:strand:- start:399 stop:1943 length:1545 start_codon:yes stop_codon:yes gene_type:complete